MREARRLTHHIAHDAAELHGPLGLQIHQDARLECVLEIALALGVHWPLLECETKRLLHARLGQHIGAQPFSSRNGHAPARRQPEI
jgi:hypothetical protein